MKTRFSMICCGLLTLLTGCVKHLDVTLNKKPEGKVLIVYYSQSENKNTQTVANWIHEQIGGDLVEIEMVTPYSDSYRDILKESKEHLDKGITPPIKALKKNVADYDVIFIGSPVWYGTFAPPVGTFLKANDFSGKTVIPFCTHGGGGAGKLYQDLAAATPGAKILPGYTAKGSNIVERKLGRGTDDKVSHTEIIDWLNKIL